MASATFAVFREDELLDVLPVRRLVIVAEQG